LQTYYINKLVNKVLHVYSERVVCHLDERVQFGFLWFWSISVCCTGILIVSVMSL